MSFKNYQAVVITDENQKNYFCGFNQEDGYLLITPEQKFFVADARYFYAVEQKLKDTDIKAVIGKDFSFLGEYLKKCGIKSLGVDFGKTTLQDNKQLKKLCPKIVDVSLELENLLAVKTQREIESIKKACEITQEVFLEILPLIKVGVCELEIKAEIIYRFLKRGATNTSFDPIVAFGANSAVPHHQSGNTKLEYETPILIDMGCKVEGYCSDFTRTFYFGENPPKDFIFTYNAVLEAFEESVKQIEIGKNCKEIDKVARDILTRENLDFKHSLGHGAGVFIHEKPYLSPSSKDKIECGNVFSVEPGAYKDGLYGVRIEDLVCVTKEKIVNFYTVTKRLIILDKNNKQFIF